MNSYMTYSISQIHKHDFIQTTTTAKKNKKQQHMALHVNINIWGCRKNNPIGSYSSHVNLIAVRMQEFEH